MLGLIDPLFVAEIAIEQLSYQLLAVAYTTGLVEECKFVENAIHLPIKLGLVMVQVADFCKQRTSIFKGGWHEIVSIPNKKVPWIITQLSSSTSA